jgi:hypothetical protein
MNGQDYHSKMQTLVEFNRIPGTTWSDKIAYLSYTMRNDRDCPVTHKFEPGWYMREIFIPAQTYFIGRIHTEGHICKLVKGRVLHITEEEKRIREAPYTMHTSKGYQVVLYTYTDVIGRTYHSNPDDLHDTDKLEALVFESAESVLERGMLIAESSRLKEAV